MTEPAGRARFWQIYRQQYRQISASKTEKALQISRPVSLVIAAVLSPVGPLSRSSSAAWRSCSSPGRSSGAARSGTSFPPTPPVTQSVDLNTAKADRELSAEPVKIQLRIAFQHAWLQIETPKVTRARCPHILVLARRAAGLRMDHAQLFGLFPAGACNRRSGRWTDSQAWQSNRGRIGRYGTVRYVSPAHMSVAVIGPGS